MFWATLCKNESNLLLVRIPVCIESCLPIGWRTFIWWKIPPKCCSILVWKGDVGILYSWAVIQRQLMSLSYFWSTVRWEDRSLSTCKPWSKQAGGWIHFCMKRLRTLNSYQIIKIKNKKIYSGLVFFSRPIQWYHYHADPIWPDGTFNLLLQITVHRV